MIVAAERTFWTTRSKFRPDVCIIAADVWASFLNVHMDQVLVDEAALIDADKMMRIGRLIYYLGETIANTLTRPAWDPASRARIVESAPTP